MSDVRNFDPVKAQALSEVCGSILNGEMTQTVVEIYNCCKTLGEDMPVIQALSSACKEYQEMFNGNLVPCTNSYIGNICNFTDYAKYVTNMTAGATAKVDDMGQIAEQTYDAAKNL